MDWDRWAVMGIIGFAVGIVGFLLHQTIDLIAEHRVHTSLFQFLEQCTIDTLIFSTSTRST